MSCDIKERFPDARVGEGSSSGLHANLDDVSWVGDHAGRHASDDAAANIGEQLLLCRTHEITALAENSTLTCLILVDELLQGVVDA